MLQARRQAVLAPVVVGAFLLVLWLAVAARYPALVPTPARVWTHLLADLSHGDLLNVAAYTASESLAGTALAAALSLPLAYLLTHVPLLRAALEPYLAASQAVPAVAVAPLLVLWIGYGWLPTVLLCALMVFFPLVATAAYAFAKIDRHTLEAARLDGAGPARLWWSIELPLAATGLLTGLRTAGVLSVTGAVVGEFIAGGRGLGSLLTIYRDRADVAGVVVVILTLVVLATVWNLPIRFLEKRTVFHD